MNERVAHSSFLVFGAEAVTGGCLDGAVTEWTNVDELAKLIT